MTAQVIDLADHRVARAEGWSVFRVLCPCGHRWVAVAPGEPTTFECPRCAAHNGRAADAATWEAAPPEEPTTMNNMQTDDRISLPIAHLAADKPVTLDIACGLNDLFFLVQSTENGGSLADVLRERDRSGGAPVGAPCYRVEDVAYVCDVLAGKTDADIYEREARDNGRPIVSDEEYTAASHGRTVPASVMPPYDHAPARRKHFDAVRRAFVLTIADSIATRDENCRLNGHHWYLGGTRRGTPDA